MTTLIQDPDWGCCARGDGDVGILPSALGIQPGQGLHVWRPGKMSAMAMASAPRNHEMMMKSAKKVPNGTVFFMEGGWMHMVSGTLDPTGNFYRP